MMLCLLAEYAVPAGKSLVPNPPQTDDMFTIVPRTLPNLDSG